MTLTPQDIQTKEFREAFRGYKQDDVDTFLDEVAEAFAAIYLENQRLRIQVATAQQDVGQRTPAILGAPAAAEPVPTVRAEERAEAREEMKRALVATQRAAEAALEEAKRRAAEIVARAEQRAKEIDDLTARRAKEVDADAGNALTFAQERVEALRRQEQELRARLRRMLAEHVKMLQQLEGEAIGAGVASAAGPEGEPEPGDDVTLRIEPAKGPGTRGRSERAAAVIGNGGGLGSRPTIWDTPRSSPRATGSNPPARAAVVERMTKDLGEAAEAPRPGRSSPPTDAFWRR